MTSIGPPQSIPLPEFNAALAELDFQTAQWYRAQFGDSCRICVESPASRQFMLAMLDYQAALVRMGGDFSVPFVLLAATMLQTGYLIGRRRAEAEVLEGWMTL